MDPLAEDYAFQTPYAYAINNPISFIDFLGLGPIYGPDGTIIGYEVEEGQGPTQIAQDLNENYSCELTCEVGWTEIVYNNAEQFKNVIDGEGNIEDKYNGDYESGNIAEGDVLEITNGIDQTKVSSIENLISEKSLQKQKNKKTSDSLYTEWSNNSSNIFNEIKDGRKDPGGRPNTGFILQQGWEATKNANGRNELRDQNKTIDKTGYSGRTDPPNPIWSDPPIPEV